MAPYDVLARRAARDSTFEVMMWYSFYLISEGKSEDLQDAWKQQIQQIVKAAEYYGFHKKKIYEFSLSSFVLIMDRVHETYAKGYPDFESISQSFSEFLQVLMDDNLIDANPLAILLSDPGYLDKYWK